MSFVYLIWSEKNFLIKYVKALSKAYTLSGKLFRKQIGQKYEFQLAACIRLLT